MIFPLGKYNVCRTNYSHPDIKSGQHTNGPAEVWVQSDGEWLRTGLFHVHKVAEWLREFGDEYIAMLRNSSASNKSE